MAEYTNQWPPCLKGAVSEADWGIRPPTVCGAGITFESPRPSGAPPFRQGGLFLCITATVLLYKSQVITRPAPGHPPLGKGGFSFALLHPPLYTKVNVFTYTCEILIYFVIWNPNHLQIPRFQNLCPNIVFLPPRRFKVLRSIQLYDQSGIMAIKIHNVMIDHLLPQKSNGIAS